MSKEIQRFSRDALQIYEAFAEAIGQSKKEVPLMEDWPEQEEEIPKAILKNIKLARRRRNNDLLAQYYYLGISNQHLELRMSPKEVRTLTDQGKDAYAIARFMAESLEHSGIIPYIEGISPEQIDRLTVREARRITVLLTERFPWKPIQDHKKRKASEEILEPQTKRLETKLSSPAPDVKESPVSSPFIIEYLDFLNELSEPKVEVE
jgi:hypothetical protein